MAGLKYKLLMDGVDTTLTFSAADIQILIQLCGAAGQTQRVQDLSANPPRTEFADHQVAESFALSLKPYVPKLAAGDRPEAEWILNAILHAAGSLNAGNGGRIIITQGP